MKKELDVVAALIKKGDKFLLCQRKEDDRYANLWEFPGGTVEEDEDLKEAIKREIDEELGLNIEPNNLITTISDEDEDLIIKVFLFACTIKKGLPKAIECKDFGFFSSLEVEGLGLAPADRKIFNYLKGRKF